jgi:myo-inositol 2-dehydrogenase / D-chiro-inositol 1-dehydrogenase
MTLQPADNVRLGLIGCGRMGSVHMEAASALPQLEFAAACDPLLASNARGALRCPLLDLEELLESPSIEALVIAAPTSLHGSLVARGLDHGKHILCEKPLTLDPALDLLLAERASERGLILQVGFWRRFAEPCLRVRSLVRDGRIGRASAIRAAQWDATPPPPAFCDPRVSGGIEIDCGVHEFDFARWLTGGEIEEVSACGAVPTDALADVGDVDTVYGLARLSGGHAMTIDLTRRAGYRDSIRTEVIGTNGSIVADFAESGALIVQWEDQREVIELISRTVILDAVRAQLGAFAHAVRTGCPVPDAAGAHDSRQALLASEALRRARETACWCKVPA